MWLNREFSLLRDYIRESDHQEVSGLIQPEDIFNLWFWSIDEIIPILQRLFQLTYFPEKTLDVIDFDDTLYSRTPQLQEARFQENRWEAGNKMILEELGWYSNFTERYYSTTNLVKNIVQVVLSKTSLILTAGKIELQGSKLNKTRLSRAWVNVNVVASSKDKPRQLLEYIVNDLWYIPGKIIIYDDRVRYFKKAWPALSKMLWWIEIVIDKVKLKDSDISNIQRIEQTIYSAK